MIKKDQEDIAWLIDWIYFSNCNNEALLEEEEEEARIEPSLDRSRPSSPGFYIGKDRKALCSWWRLP